MGTFPVRLSGEEWVSGENNWLLDILAPSQSATSAVLRNFAQVAGDEGIHLHPNVSGAVDPALLAKAASEKSSDEAVQLGLQKKL